MATVAVVFHGQRVEDADTVTGWTNIGGGGGIATEPDIVYQGNAAASRKVSTSPLGRGFEDTVTWNMTHPTASTWIAKLTATNAAALELRTAPAMIARIGTGAAVYYDYYVAGRDNYPAKAGWLLIPINPSIAGYRDATLGVPSISAMDYWAIVGDFIATAKAENLIIDAIDIGIGMNLIGGDGVDPDGTFEDFVDFDQGTLTNRYGIVTSQEGIVFVNGQLIIGETTGSLSASVETIFNDNNRVLVWNNGYFATGYAGLKFNIANVANDITLSSCTFIGRGKINNDLDLGYVTTEDTRPNLIVTGSMGTFNMSSTNLQNFNTASFTLSCSVDNCDLFVARLIQGGAQIENSTIRTTSTSSIATLKDPTFGTSTGLNNSSFIQSGDGHAIEMVAAGSYTFTGLNFVGYGNDGSDSASLDITAISGEVTISISNGSTPTYKTAGASVSIQNPIIFTVTGMESGSEIRLVSNSIELSGQESIDTDEDFTYNYNYPGYDQLVNVIVHSLNYQYFSQEIILGNLNSSLPIQQTLDRNYENPPN